MRRISNYIFLAATAFALVACVDDLIGPEVPSSAGGEEVQFGLLLENPETKTIYGAEAGNAFPVYWADGDKVLVYSPQCVKDRNCAEYEVTPVAGQSYAEAMTKTGAYGVQWGVVDADFYSIYPSRNASFQNLESGDVQAKLSIAENQSANLVLDNGEYRSADMQNVVMYAQTKGVENGKPVNLIYKPYSTVLEFELNIVKPSGEGSENATLGSIKILSMTLDAGKETAIAGDFTLKFPDSGSPEIAAAGNNSSIIKMDFATQPVLNETNQTLKAKLAILPVNGLQMKDWTIAFEVREGNDDEVKTFTKKLNVATAIAPGKIHKIKLPNIVTGNKWVYEKNDWITSLYDYKNIYLTELSLPGAWYAGAPTSNGYQATDDIAALWTAGVRAFAVECKTSSNWRMSPEAVVISGTGDNGAAGTGIGSHYRNGTKIRTVIKSVADAISKNEFGVLVLSYADGGTHGLRAEDFEYFIKGVQTEIASSGATNIYSNEITPFTTVQDVQGSLIIKINVDSNLLKNSYDDKANMLFSYNPFLVQLGTEYYSVPVFSKLYWKSWADTNKTLFNLEAAQDTDFLWCFSSANRTQVNTGTDTTIPTYNQRQTALRAMMEHSKELTENEQHNIWFYFNAGGAQTTSNSDKSTSATDFAKVMNKWLYDVVNLKANGGTDTEGVFGTPNAKLESQPSPLGIIMFNQCTGDNDIYRGEDIIKEIIEMNDKFKLLRRETKSTATSYASGMNSSDSAFGWD